jgi:N-acetylglucosamine-6-phosphate deacetylase
VARLLLRDALLLDPEARAPEPGSLLLDGPRILGRQPAASAAPEGFEVRELGGRAIAPGLLDLHHHGGLIFAASQQLGAALRRDAASCARHGVTAFLPTSVAWDAGALAERVGILARELGEVGAGASPLGLHLEGPWISACAAGAQPASAIRGYDRREGVEILERAGGLVRLVTLAPEVEGADDLLAELERRGVVAALGHTRADAARTQAAVDRGLRHVTHLFNAMGALHHREPGALGVALGDDRLSCDLICDGAHVDPAVVRLAARLKRDRMLLISDRVEPPAEEADASFGSGALRSDGVALRLPDGRLAGSCLTLDRALRNAVEFGAMSLLEAVAACTLRPARLLGIESERGTLRPGARADLVILGPELALEETWIGGRRVHP